MKHMTRQETLIMRLLSRARTIAVVGASPRPERHSHTVVAYLHRVGYDVIPVRPDLQQVDGLKSFARLADIPVQVDLAVIFRRADAAPRFVAEAASKRVEAVWLPPGVWTRQAEEQAREHTCRSSRIAASRKTIAICRKTAGILRASEFTSVAAAARTRTIERIWKRKGIPLAGVEVARAAAESAPCSTRRKWSGAVPRRGRAPASALVKKSRPWQ
jgi:uncharacterized protein